MCLLAFALAPGTACPLVVTGNRDEALDRPTETLQVWPLRGHAILGGRDRLAGGTWLGVGNGGRVALLTNVRGPDTGTPSRSRGDLTTDWLTGTGSSQSFAEALEPHAYGGFNLVIGDLHAHDWRWITNRDPDAPHQNSPMRVSRALQAGTYGLSNAALDTPWPKTLRLREALQAELARHALPPTDPGEALLTALGHDRPEADSNLPATGVPVIAERALSSPFVRMPWRAYGTRSSAWLRILKHGCGDGWQAHMVEWTHDHDHLQAAGTSAPFTHATRREATLWIPPRALNPLGE